MKLHTVMVTYNRLESTKQSIESFLDTVSVPHWLWIVDNGSDDGTQEWIEQLFHDGYLDGKVLYRENHYPGKAVNHGWSMADDSATHLHRADNDWTFLPGWCDQVERAFRNPKVGQVGLRTQKEEPVIWNVGGNNVIRRELWECGLRYDERPWTELPAGHSEDTYLSPAVKAMGYDWVRVKKPCIVGNSVESTEDPYYRKSYADRRIYGFG